MTVEAFLGEIRMFAGAKNPGDQWMICNGDLLQISAHQTLYTLIGTTYGGNGTTTFALPDLRGRVAVQAGNKAPGVVVEYGQTVGAEKVALNTSHVPFHNHRMLASPSDGQFTKSTGFFLANTGLQQAYSPKPSESLRGSMAPNTLAPTGENLSVPVTQPYLSINYIIAVSGEFPSES